MAEKRNVTLSLERELIRRAKILAAKKGVSLSGLMAQSLESVVEDDDRAHEAKRSLTVLARKGMDLGTGGRIAWKREELHAR